MNLNNDFNKNSKILRIVWFCLFVFVIALGIFLRLSNYNVNPLWLDEAIRANIISDMGRYFTYGVQGPLNPIGYMFLNNALSKIYNTEYILRLTSLIPSILSLYLVFLISSKITKSKLIVLFSVFLAAVNPMLIRYAKELKPYSLELCLHLLLCYLIINIVEKKSYKHAMILFSAAVASLMFATNIVFLIPSICLMIYLYSSKIKDVKFYFFSIAGSLLFAAVLLILYFKIHTPALNSEGLLLFWKKAFYLSEFNIVKYFIWVSKHLVSMFYSAIKIYPVTSIILVKPIYTIVLGGVYLTGLMSCAFKKKYEYLILFALPVAVVILFNIFEKWPIGAVRMNMFMFCYILFPIVIGLNIIVSQKILKKIGILLIIIFFVVKFPYKIHSFIDLKPKTEDILSCMEYVYSDLTKAKLDDEHKPIIAVNSSGMHAFTYYSKHHSKFAGKYDPLFYDHCETVRCVLSDMQQLKNIIKKNKKIIFIYSHMNKTQIRKFQIELRKHANIPFHKKYVGAGIMYWEYIGKEELLLEK